MDINFKNEDGEFKYRVVGILIDEKNRLLVQVVANNQFYCLPGGRVEIGESSNEALARELREELGFPVEIGQPAFFIENFFVSSRTNILAHELGVYFKVKSEYAPKEDWDFVENDKGEIKPMKYRWINLEDIDKVDLRPRFLKEKLLTMGDKFEQLVLKNGEIKK